MRISDEFPSQFLRAADIGPRDIRKTMDRVEREKVGQDLRLVLYFKGEDRGLVLNKTNAYTIGDAYGEDTEEWVDQPLILFSVKTDYQGKVVDAIRCRVPTAKDNRDTAPRRTTGGVSDNLKRDAGFPGDRDYNEDDIPEHAR